jgi:hypothetical protein
MLQKPPFKQIGHGALVVVVEVVVVVVEVVVTKKIKFSFFKNYL